MATLIIENCAIATVDPDGTEHTLGHIVVDGNRIAGVAAGPAPPHPHARRVDGRGCLATPGLVNTHHHLYQWATRGLAQDSTLFGWLQHLYPMWTRLDEQITHDAAAAGLGWLAMSGTTTTADHHYLFPGGADLLTAEIEAARTVGLRFHPCRGSMDRGQSAGGLPPDDAVEDIDAILDATFEAIDRHHDPSPDSMLRVAVAPCSPFSVSSELLARSAELARAGRVRMHTHIAETLDEETFCRGVHGCGPVEYLEQVGWLGDDAWLAHGVHLSETEIKQLARAGTAIAHCPSSNGRLGAGIAPVRALLDAGVPVGLGVDGPASQESGLMAEELRQALYLARIAGGPEALSVREALALGTVGGARCLGREAEIGSLEAGKLADIALWRLDGLGHRGIADPVAALVLGPPAPVELLIVNGRPVIDGGSPRTFDPIELALRAETAARRIAGGIR
ncbi:8-oxoguanine deaminase [Phytomonospora sp. NPDC050363]|uniref:8-oxoguanine deaminase n=1 Tax=Phytomonospora sp. NPDC050363 TaxID=3155642 RepID=UPI0034011F66